MLVLVVAVLLVAATTVALTTAASSSGQTGTYGNRTTARLDAESGFQAAMLQIKNATSWQGLPSCSATTTDMTYGSYTVSVAYSATDGSSLCPLGSSLPISSTAVITSVGQYGGQSAEIQGNLTLDAQPQPLPAFDYAIYTPGDVSMNTQASLYAGSTTALPNVYSGGTFRCTDTNLIQGNVETYQLGELDSSCAIQGTLYVQTGGAYLTNNVKVGSLETFGGSLSMDSTPTIAGNVYVSGGNASFSTSAVTIDGNLNTTGTVSMGPNGANNVKGTVCSGSPSCIPSGMTMPAAPPFPEVTDPGTPSAWPPGTDYISVSSSKCSSFFANSTSPNTLPSTFNIDVNGSSAPVTVVDAPTCSVDLPGPSKCADDTGSSTYTLNTDLVMFVKAFNDYGCNTFQSASGSHHTLAIVVPYGDGTGEIYGTNTTTFASNVDLLLYTPGEVYFDCAATMTGQLIAGTEVYTTNTFSLTASDAAASTIPTATQSGTVTVTKYSENLLQD